jgi:TonB-linked SusC/RagA family outer membrane protein
MKKKLFNHGLCLKIMKISIIQMVLAICFVSFCYSRDADAQGMLETRISIRIEDKSLKTVLTKLEKEAKVRFMYSVEVIQADRTVALNAKNQPLGEVLETLLSPLNILYRSTDNGIVLTPKAIKLGQIQRVQQSQAESPADIVIKGTVTDESGEKLPGVSVTLKGSTRGSTTNTNGDFTLDIPNEKAVLVFSFVGYLAQEVIVGNKTTFNITLKLDNKALNEVVVVGYGTVKKSDITGSVSSIKAEEINAFPVQNAMQSLNGRAAGVHVVQNSGAPGATLSVKIRGGNSLQGSNEPLYVVDGFPLTGNINAINPADIESMEILKDASATAIYGSRGANGVVIITTKGGKSGKGRIDFETYYSTQQVIKKLELLNATEFATLMNERAVNDRVASPYFTQNQIASFGEGTDWQNEIFRSAPLQNHSLTFSGGNDKTKYSIGGSWFDQQGIIKNSGFGRGSIRANINSEVNKVVSLSLSTIYSKTANTRLRSDNSVRGDGALSAAMVAPPTITPYNATGGYNRVDAYSFSPNVLESPLVFLNEITDNGSSDELILNSAINFKIMEGLNLKLSGGLQNFNQRNDRYSSRALRGTPTGSANVGYNQSVSYLNENILSYQKQFNTNHSISALVGFTFQNNINNSLSSGAAGFPSDALSFYNLQSGSVPGVPNTGYQDWTMLSYLGRINYTFKDKLLVTLSGRSDGSSRFGKDNKWGYFPSGAIAYRLTEEGFLKNSKTISDLKVRASWGSTGSTAVSPYQTLNLLSSQQVIFNDAIFVGFTPAVGFPNPNLKWETTTQTNFGLDIGFLNQKITATLDFYNKKTTDLLASVLLPTTTGYTSSIKNVGSVQNRGLELGVNANIINKNSLRWDLGFNISTNKNKALKLAGGADVFGAPLAIPFNVPVNLIREGQPVGVFFAYREEGLDETGQIKYKDLNNDKVINANDREIIGDPNPDFIYGLNSNFSFKGFELSFFLQGVQGNDIFNFNKSGLENSFNFGENQTKAMLNRWTTSNPDPNAPYPKLSVNTRFRESDRYVEDGSFLRLKTVQLAYNIPTDKLPWLRSSQLYVSGQNLFTATKYSWYDPEVSTRGNGLTSGIDIAGYPPAKSYTIGLRLGF